jgi:hypothetical protein
VSNGGRAAPRGVRLGSLERVAAHRGVLLEPTPGDLGAYQASSFGDWTITLSSLSSIIWANTAFICIPMSTTTPIT